jgi:hypothetical protein
MTSTQDAEALAAVNNRIASGAGFPVVTLRDGSKIQTGTIGGLISNIKAYDQMMKGESIEGMLSCQNPQIAAEAKAPLRNPRQRHHQEAA